MYTTVTGDMWDWIAKKLFGNELYAEQLMAANSEYLDTLVFSAGVVLTIPTLEAATNTNLPPWRR